MKKLERYEYNCMGYVCTDEDVARLEASHANLQAKCAELQRLLDSYIEAFDVMNDSMTWAHRIIADPDSIAVIDLPTESMVAKNAELLEAAKAAESALRDYDIAAENEWGECRNREQMEKQRAWSDEVYTLRAAIAKAEGEQT